MVESKDNQEAEPSRSTMKSLAQLKWAPHLLEQLILNSPDDFSECTKHYPFDYEIWEAVQLMEDEIKKLERQGYVFTEEFDQQYKVINEIVDSGKRLSVSELKERLPSLAILITRIHARLRAQKWFGNRK